LLSPLGKGMKIWSIKSEGDIDSLDASIPLGGFHGFAINAPGGAKDIQTLALAERSDRMFVQFLASCMLVATGTK